MDQNHTLHTIEVDNLDITILQLKTLLVLELKIPVDYQVISTKNGTILYDTHTLNTVNMDDSIAIKLNIVTDNSFPKTITVRYDANEYIFHFDTNVEATVLDLKKQIKQQIGLPMKLIDLYASKLLTNNDCLLFLFGKRIKLFKGGNYFKEYFRGIGGYTVTDADMVQAPPIALLEASYHVDLEEMSAIRNYIKRIFNLSLSDHIVYLFYRNRRAKQIYLITEPDIMALCRNGFDPDRGDFIFYIITKIEITTFNRNFIDKLNAKINAILSP